MKTYSIISKDKVWAFNYDTETFERIDSLGKREYNDIALARKLFNENLEEDERNDYEIIDNSTGKPVK